MKAFKKYILRILAVVTLLSLSAPKAYADFDWPSPSESAQEGASGVASKYGLDEDELTNAVDILNVARLKKQNPQVPVSFSPSDPAPGEKVTATAAPIYFMNTNENLYFTWYLKTDKDLNDDGRVNIEDYKINAARIIASNDFEYQNADYSNDSDNDGFDAPLGGKDQQGKNNHCFIHDQKNGGEFEIQDCSHLFPNAPDHTTGDGHFGKEEEQFWRTDPNDPDTAGTGNMDEANVAGLATSNFTWTYESGDELGVAVEGISSEPTTYQDSSYKIMFAIGGDGCGDISDKFSDPSESTEESSDATVDNGDGTSTVTTTTITYSYEKDSITGFEEKYTTTTVTEKTIDNVTGNTISGPDTISSETVDNGDTDTNLFNMTMGDVNDCLKENMAKPSEGGGSKENMDVSLSVSPENPMNDASGSENGDQLIVTATVNNADNPNYVNYTWQVYESDESNPDDWGDPMLRSELPGATQTSGLGLNTLKFNLNFKDPPKYLKVKLNVSESASDGGSKKGHADIEIPINSSSNKIKVYTTNTYSDLSLNKNKQICTTDGIDDAICRVAKDEIIAVEASEGNLSSFLWTKDGESISCVSGSCSSTGESSSLTYFPVLEESGSTFTVNLSATNQETGEKVELTKSFEVAVPKAEINSKDEGSCQPNLLGYYEDLDGNKWPDYSTSNFQAVEGSSISLGANFYAFSPESSDINWYVDGNLNGTGESISLASNKSVGDSYSVTVSALYKPDNNTKKALNQYWGVSQGDFYEKTITKTINIRIVSSLETGEENAKKNSTKIFASVYSGLPNYLAFLFRIVLTTLLMISIMWFISSLSLNSRKDNG